MGCFRASPETARRDRRAKWDGKLSSSPPLRRNSVHFCPRRPRSSEPCAPSQRRAFVSGRTSTNHGYLPPAMMRIQNFNFRTRGNGSGRVHLATVSWISCCFLFDGERHSRTFGLAYNLLKGSSISAIKSLETLHNFTQHLHTSAVLTIDHAMEFEPSRFRITAQRHGVKNHWYKFNHVPITIRVEILLIFNERLKNSVPADCEIRTRQTRTKPRYRELYNHAFNWTCQVTFNLFMVLS